MTTIDLHLVSGFAPAAMSFRFPSWAPSTATTCWSQRWLRLHSRARRWGGSLSVGLLAFVWLRKEESEVVEGQDGGMMECSQNHGLTLTNPTPHTLHTYTTATRRPRETCLSEGAASRSSVHHQRIRVSGERMYAPPRRPHGHTI